MRVLVDTSVWSHALRRKGRHDATIRGELERLITEGRVVMLGPIRQELLSGLKTEQQFERLRQGLAPFPDEQLVRDDYERAALCFNQCRRKGIQGSNTDFLLCAVALEREIPIFTMDNDFRLFQKALTIRLHTPRG